MLVACFGLPRAGKITIMVWVAEGEKHLRPNSLKVRLGPDAGVPQTRGRQSDGGKRLALGCRGHRRVSWSNTSIAAVPRHRLIGEETPDPSLDARWVLSLVTCGRVFIKTFLSVSVVQLFPHTPARAHSISPPARVPPGDPTLFRVADG